MADVFNFYVRDDRKIDFYSPEPIMQEDKDVAVWRFRIPKVLNQIDMTAWAWWFVYINSKGHQYSESLTLSDDVDEPDAFSVAEYSIDYGISKHPGSFTFALEAINADQGGEIAGEWHTYTYTHKVVGTLQGNQAEYAETQSDIISALIVEFQRKANSLVGGATPQVVSSVSAMTDTSKIYVLFTDGNWYYHNGSAWVSGGVYASGITIDPTLTQSGQAADAKETGDKFADITDQLRDNHLAKRIIKNSYVKNNGDFAAYNGWNRTDYILVDYIDTLKVTANAASNYNVFYDADKVKIPTYDSSTATAVISIVSGENVVKVPPNAKYVMFSGTAAMIDNLIIEPLKTRPEQADDASITFVQENVNSRQNIILHYDDVSIGTLDETTGAETGNAYVMRTGLIPIINTQNSFSVKCEGFRFYIYEYSYTGSAYEYVGRSAAVVYDSGKWRGQRKTTHIRIWAQTSNSNYITSGIIDSFIKVFKMSEVRDINKYMRVCTFNQAANISEYQSATLEDTKKRALNHLNFLGEHNPDIVCGQEALGDYFQPLSYEISTGDVYDRKFFYMHNPGYQRRTWSKYNMSQLAKVMFVSQASDGDRFYGKCLIAFEGMDIWVLNAHCAYQGESDFDLARKGQFEELLAEMQQHEYCICCGDFNAWSADEFEVFTDAGMNVANCGDFGEFTTWDPNHASQTWPFGAIDNIVTTPNIYIQNVFTGPYDYNLFSDHLPLLADLQIR